MCNLFNIEHLDREPILRSTVERIYLKSNNEEHVKDLNESDGLR